MSLSPQSPLCPLGFKYLQATWFSLIWHSIGNGQGLPIQSAGSNTFTSPLYTHTLLTLEKLLLVLSITKNLISISQFSRDSSVYFVFYRDKCLIKYRVSDGALLEGHVGSDGLSAFQPLDVSTSAKSTGCFVNKPMSSIYVSAINSKLSSVWHL